MINLSDYSCDKCAREFSRHCKHCYHTADKPPTRFKKKKKTGVQTPEFRKTTPPPPSPTSGSNARKPNPNYVPPASVAKTRTMVCHMKLEDLNKWVETTAQIGDIAYCHDRMTDNHYVYCFNNPDRNPVWYRILPEYLEDLQKEKDKGDCEMMGTINCTYETPCGWCTKWDKKCDKKIGGYPTVDPTDKTPKSHAQKTIDYIKSGKGLPPLGFDDNFGLQTLNGKE